MQMSTIKINLFAGEYFLRLVDTEKRPSVHSFIRRRFVASRRFSVKMWRSSWRILPRTYPFGVNERDRLSHRLERINRCAVSHTALPDLSFILIAYAKSVTARPLLSRGFVHSPVKRGRFVRELWLTSRKKLLRCGAQGRRGKKRKFAEKTRSKIKSYRYKRDKKIGHKRI